MVHTLDETRFHALADATQTHCFDQLDAAYEAGDLEELDLQGGILTMITATHKTFLLTKHSPSCQLWLASPTAGGLHFMYQPDSQQWQLADQRTLYAVLQQELAAQHVKVTL